MAQDDLTCTAITTAGTRCGLKASASGYCHVHDPAQRQERDNKRQLEREERERQWAKGERLRKMLEVIAETCEAKGWHSSTVKRDEDHWRYATVNVERTLATGSFRYETVTAIIEISTDGQYRVSYTPTSFYHHGLPELWEAISRELKTLPWMQPIKPATPSPNAALQRLLQLLARFHRVARQLATRHDQRATIEIKDEYDTQDLLRALLWSTFDNVRKEEYTPSYAGRSSRMDFLLKQDKIVVEVKFATSKLREKDIADQLFIDIKRYQAHPDCSTLVCFVYDPGSHVDDPAVLDELSRKHDSLTVQVVVVPRHQ